MAKTFRVGIIGRTGRGDYGHALDIAWKNLPNVEIVAVADDDKMGLVKAAARLEVQTTYSDYREMLDKSKLDIVSICPRWIDVHHEMILAAADRGIHILVEKPLCRSLVEADEIVAACERTHAKLAMALQTRYSPLIPVVKKLIADKRIGDVIEFRGRGKEDVRGGGLDLWVLGTHILDLIRVFGGDPQWCFGHVTQDGRAIQKSDINEGSEGIAPLAGDGVSAMYGLPNNMTAYFASQRQAGNGKRFALQILGTLGMIEIGTGYVPTVKFLRDPAWSPGRSNAKWQNVSSAGVEKPEPIADVSQDAGNRAAVKDLLEAIEQNREPVANVYNARAAVEMVAAVFESQRVGKPVSFPLETRVNPLTLLK